MGKRKIKKNNYVSYRQTWADAVLEYPIACIICGLIAIVFGAFFIFLQSDNKPITKAEAEAYTGTFEKYQSHRNYCYIDLEDGSSYNVYPHTQTEEFRDRMEKLEKGTVLYILVNPNNDYVAELRTDSEEILNFEKSQEAIESYDNGYVGIGIFVIVCGAFLIALGVMKKGYKNKEKERQKRKKQKNIDCDDGAIRYADFSVKYRVLLQKSYKEYKICYRRVNHVNELVVNGRVYDEKKGIIEFAHKLSARIDGHLIEAGYDGNEISYINFDKRRIAEKKRYI